MAPTDATASSRPTRWGLAASVLGYMRAGDALQDSIYNQLTATRKSKARQVETYFRTIRNELSQLATSKMAVDAAREGQRRGLAAEDVANGVGHESRVGSGMVGASARKLSQPPPRV